MNWQFGDDEPITEQPEDDRSIAPPREPVSRSRRRVWLLLFLIALAASWTTGFYLGRVQRTTAELEAEVQGRLDVESWAWQHADWDLFRSLLPPRTPSWHLKSLQMTFNDSAPRNISLELMHYVVSEDGSQIQAVVQALADRRQYTVERTYRWIDGRWRLVRIEELGGALMSP